MLHFFLIYICLPIGMLRCENILAQNDVLNEFKHFIESTSAIEPLIFGSPGLKNELNHENDDIPYDDAWETSGKFEGDILLNKRQRLMIVHDVAEREGLNQFARNGLNDISKRWPSNELVYYIHKPHFEEDQIDAIKTGIEDIQQNSCVKLRPYQKGDRDVVVVTGSKRGCFSAVGYQSGYQILNLSNRHPVGKGCFRHGTVVHELLHSLGFFHMQSNPNRDDFIEIKWNNIVRGAEHNFKKYNTFAVTDYGIPYDYDSVLHYSKRAFSKNGRSTIVPKDSGVRIGQRVGMSDKDVEKLNKMYCSNEDDPGNNNSLNDSNQYDDEPFIFKTDKKKKKKTPKRRSNKPFNGSGLGYYKGKSVIIKFPEADEYFEEEESPKSEDKQPEENDNKVKINNNISSDEGAVKSDDDKFDFKEFSLPRSFYKNFQYPEVYEGSFKDYFSSEPDNSFDSFKYPEYEQLKKGYKIPDSFFRSIPESFSLRYGKEFEKFGEY